jgi:Protein of unknown function (DUF3716)
MEAYLGQLTGPENANACSHCRKGAGIWVLCVSVEGFFGGSCSNCHYNNEGVRCSLRKFFGSFLSYLQWIANLRTCTVGGTATLASVTAAINAAAAVDPIAPEMSTTPETPATPQTRRFQRRITPINLSPTPRSLAFGRGRAAPSPAPPTPAAWNSGQRGTFLLLFNVVTNNFVL